MSDAVHKLVRVKPLVWEQGLTSDLSTGTGLMARAAPGLYVPFLAALGSGDTYREKWVCYYTIHGAGNRATYYVHTNGSIEHDTLAAVQVAAEMDHGARSLANLEVAQ